MPYLVLYSGHEAVIALSGKIWVLFQEKYKVHTATHQMSADSEQELTATVWKKTKFTFEN